MPETDRRVRRAMSGDGGTLRSRVLPLDDIEILSRAKGGDGRTVVAYAAVFGQPAEITDQDGHYTEENHPQAFHKTVADRGTRFGTFYHHGRTLHGTPSEEGSVPIGRPVLVKPDGKGLLTHTAYNQTPLADRVLESIRNGDPMGMSYTGIYLQSDPPVAPYYSRSDGSLQHVVRREIALIEYGPTPTPAFVGAEILGIRAAQARQAAAAADTGAPDGPEPYSRHDGEDVQCPACGKYDDDDAVFCDQCDTPLPDSAFPDGRQQYQRDPGEDVQCPACARFNMPDAVYCDQCGVKLPATAYEGVPAIPGGTDAYTAQVDTDAGASGQRAAEPDAAERPASPSGGDTTERAGSTARHEPVDGWHSHAHPAYGSQGGDATHTHRHQHQDDASHNHSHDQDGMPGTSSSGRDPHADAERERTAVPVHHTPVTDTGPWTAGTFEDHIQGTPQSVAQRMKEFTAWYDSTAPDPDDDGLPDAKGAYKLPHHVVSDNGTVGAAHMGGVRAALAALGGARGGADIPDAQKAATRAHLQAHLSDWHKQQASSEGGSGDAGAATTSDSGRSATPAADGTEAGATAAGTTVEPQQHSTAAATTEGNTTVEGTDMTIGQRTERRAAIEARILAIGEEHQDRALPADVQAEWDRITVELDEHDRAISDHERTVAARRERVAAIAARQRPASTGQQAGERVDGGAAGYTQDDGAAGAGQRGAPALVGGRTGSEIYDVTAIRSRASNPEQLSGLYRDNAMRAIERATFPGSQDRARAQGTVERLVNSIDTEEAALAQRILVTGNPLYQRAWAKMTARLSPAGLSAEEARALEHGRALALGVGADGGYAVPFQLDPTVILTSDGAINPLRQISRVETIVGKEFDLVTSTGVTVSRSAEASAMPDNSPTLAQPTIKAERLTGFIPFSMEIEQDWAALQSQMMMLLADAKDVEEAHSFTLGDGTGTNAGGIITTLAESSQITGTGGVATLSTDDLYGLEDAMAPRFRARASWMASKTGFNAYRRLFVQDASAAGDQWVRPSQGMPPELIGYPAYENSAMTTTHATGDMPIILGDFGRGFLIVDRLGMSTEIAPMLFDPATGRPTGQRGLVMFWRNNSRVIVDNAFRLLVVG